MPACPSCGGENPEGFAFCGFCGAAMARTDERRRKLITAVFTDVVGSTSLGETRDAETVQAAMERYFDEARAAAERHGGTVEKFIGDAVVSMFGIHVAHEDDALRAVRAARELHDAMESVNDELEERLGVRIQIRTGVNTGEVVAGELASGGTLATGDTTNVAARLEQAAPPGEILIGPVTYRLVRDAVHAEQVEPLTLKGKREPVHAWRLGEVRARVDETRPGTDTPLVGRDRELDHLRTAFEEAARRERCRLATVVAPAGTGKTRLVTETLRDLDPAVRVLRGRCLSYGEAVTFWPITEAIRRAAGISLVTGTDEARAAIAALGTGVPQPLLALLGMGDPPADLEETFGGVRSFLEDIAAHAPVVLVVEDLHWAEPTLLDLLEDVLARTRGPVFLLATARGDLLQTRPAWTELSDSIIVRLDPLPEDELATLIRNLLPGVPDSVLTAITAHAQGNPLFAKELVAMLLDEGRLVRSDSGWETTGDVDHLDLPTSVDALLTARLDRLTRDERGVMEAASIIGLEFSERAVRALLDGGDGVDEALAQVERRELVRRTGDRRWAFHHILIRDAAYRGVSKQRRADLHARHGEWLGVEMGARAPDEIVGYHLERAHGYLEELGLRDPATADLARRAAHHLAAAGLRAHAQGDARSAINLLHRAASLLPDDEPTRLSLLPALGQALTEAGELTRAESVLRDLAERAASTGQMDLEAHARALQLDVLISTDLGAALERIQVETEQLLPILDRAGDHANLARMWRARMYLDLVSLRIGDMERTLDRAFEHARRSGDPALIRDVLFWMVHAAWVGPMPASEALRKLDEIAAAAPEDRKVRAVVLAEGAGLEALLGRFGEARTRWEEGRAMLDEAGMPLMLAAQLHASGIPHAIHVEAGDPTAAQLEYRWALDELQAMGDEAYLPTVAIWLADTCFVQGDLDAAERYLDLSRRVGVEEDTFNEMHLRGVSAKVAAARGRADDAISLASSVTTLVEGIQTVHDVGRVVANAADALIAADAIDDAVPLLERAIASFDAKEAVVAADAARRRLAGIRAG